MTLMEMETRLAILEAKVAVLVGKVEGSGGANLNAWIDQVHGTFQDDATYRRAARLGRNWRHARRRAE